MKFMDKLLNLIYPPNLYCICCGNIIDDTRSYSMCDHCMDHIKWISKSEIKIKGDINDLEMCKSLDRVYSCSQYGIFTRNIIFNLKYNKKTYIARVLGEILADKLRENDRKYDLIIGVPMNKYKQRRRGFNHSELIAKYLGKELGIRVYMNILVRSVDTKPMRGLDAVERKYNIKNAFIISGKSDIILKGKRVLLVDDIFTTGSTAEECGRILKEAGSESVDFIAFASGNDEVNA